jgi:hypothetical protein
MAMMTELISSIRMQAHRANIERYRRLLAGRLTRIEREYVMRRIAEEKVELKRLEDAAEDLTAPASADTRPRAEREKRAAALHWEQRL